MKLSPVDAFYTTWNNTAETIGMIFSCGYRDYATTPNLYKILFFLGKLAEYTLGNLFGCLFGIVAFGANFILNCCYYSVPQDIKINSTSGESNDQSVASLNTQKDNTPISPIKAHKSQDIYRHLKTNNNNDQITGLLMQMLYEEIPPKICEKLKEYEQKNEQESMLYKNYLALNDQLKQQENISQSAMKEMKIPGQCGLCYRHVWTTYCPCSNNSNTLFRYPGIYRTEDIERRRSAEAQAMEIREQMKFLLQTSPNKSLFTPELISLQSKINSYRDDNSPTRSFFSTKIIQPNEFEALLDDISIIFNKNGMKFDKSKYQTDQFLLANQNHDMN